MVLSSHFERDCFIFIWNNQEDRIFLFSFLRFKLAKFKYIMGHESD